MTDENSILDKVMASKQVQEASQFNPSEFVSAILKDLNTKEREILTRRFGLDGNTRQTLEEIGKLYQITRERIRQIQMSGIEKIKYLEEFKNNIEILESLIHRVLEEHGGVMEENYLLEKLLSYSENNESNRQATLFILEYMMANKINKIKSNEHLLPGWKNNLLEQEKIIKILESLFELIKQEDQLLEIEQLIEKFKSHESYDSHKEVFERILSSQDTDISDKEAFKKIIDSYLRISQKIDQNILGEWGSNRWPTVKPKRMSDKVYMILRKEKKPLHFREIADYINKADFDTKKAHPATIHNELILNDKFVLIGRGIYALTEWGYQPGTVADVIATLLKESEKPLSKGEIINKVLDSRMVKKSTINLALTNKNKFRKLENGSYLLAQ